MIAMDANFDNFQSAGYDALGRLTAWAEAGTDYAPAASLAYEYDAAGNIRRTNSTFATLDATGTATPTARDYWFRFDSMNRVVVDQGELVGGTIAGGAAGREIAYDVAGRRVSVTGGGTTELYGYDGAHRLTQVHTRPAGTSGGEVLRSAFGYDLAGRQVSQQDYDASGTNVVFNRTAAYNAKGQLASDASFTVKSDGKTYGSDTTYAYGTGSAYALGAVVSQTATSSVSETSGSTSATTTTDYVWYDGAQQSHIGYVDGTTSGNTYLGYDGASRLRVAEIQDGKPRYVDYVSDELGQVVYRREIGSVSGQTGGPHEVTYRFGGRQLGFTGNNGTTELSVDASIADRQQVTPANQGTFRNKQVTGGAYTDFAQSYDALNSYQQGSTPGGYTVQAGDTLQGIAYQVWGDGALWYKLAEANGLSMASPLIAGMQLTLPAGVVRTGYNAATMRPYDPADALGNVVPDTSPTPAPAARKKSNKCGVFGAILLAVVAVAVAVAVGPGIIGAAASTTAAGTTVAATGLTAVLGGTGAAIVGGALAGVAGSIASQAVGLVTGIQEKFSFKGVALAALSGGVGGGVGSVIGGSGFLAGAARGIAGSAITQGIAVATGLQDKFDWAGVAAAGIGGGVGGLLAPKIAGAGLGTFGARAATVSAISIADAATRSAIEGSGFGQNLLAAVPGAVGQVLGGAIGDALNKRPEGVRATRALDRANVDPKTGRGSAIGDVDLPVGPIDLASWSPIMADLGGGTAKAGMNPRATAGGSTSQSSQNAANQTGYSSMKAVPFEKYNPLISPDARYADYFAGMATATGDLLRNQIGYAGLNQLASVEQADKLKNIISGEVPYNDTQILAVANSIDFLASQADSLGLPGQFRRLSDGLRSEVADRYAAKERGLAIQGDAAVGAGAQVAQYIPIPPISGTATAIRLYRGDETAGEAVVTVVGGKVAGTVVTKSASLAGGIIGRIGSKAVGAGSGAPLTKAAETAEVPIATGFRGSKGFELVQPKYQPIRNVPGEVNGRAYSGHAFDQMQNRGIMPSVVDNTIGNGVVFPTKAGTTGYYDAVNKVQVIVNSSTGRVVTVIRGKP